MKCKAQWMSWHGRGRSAPHGGKREDLGGRYFRSTWEANWARYLNWMQQRGEIVSWRYEPTTFEFPVKRGSKFYTPDFEITKKDGTVYFEEVKGYMDAKSATKLKRMEKYHPKVKVIVIGHSIYNAAHKNFCRLIPNWESPS